MMSNNPADLKKNSRYPPPSCSCSKQHTAKGTYFFDYGNAFLLESSRAGADVMAEDGINFRYPSYVQDIMGPMCFDYGFGPFRWVCASGKPEDLLKTDQIACKVLEDIMQNSPVDIQQQMADNINGLKVRKKTNWWLDLRRVSFMQMPKDVLKLQLHLMKPSIKAKLVRLF